jgi:nitrogen fixation protein NifU and related proteins
MATDLRDLYQEVILDHNRRPRNFGPLPGADRRAEGHNPLCGDQVAVYLKLDGDVIQDVSFEGSGCAISTASASLMTEAVKGRTVEEARRLFGGFQALVTGKVAETGNAAPGAEAELGKLVALGGVREYPMRVKCATLAWHTLKAALAGGEDRPAGGPPVSTE